MQNTHNVVQLETFHSALLKIVFQFNNPNRDDILINAADIHLDRALFPLLIAIGRFGPVGVVGLADMVGRDYTTVSRQVAKLVNLKLVSRQQDTADKRINKLAIAPDGQKMIDKIDITRRTFYQQIFNQWDEQELMQFIQMLDKFANGLHDVDRGSLAKD